MTNPTLTKAQALATLAHLWDEYSGLEDWFEEIISDSIDMDWTPRIAAQALMRGLSVPVAVASPPLDQLYPITTTYDYTPISIESIAQFSSNYGFPASFPLTIHFIVDNKGFLNILSIQHHGQEIPLPRPDLYTLYADIYARLRTGEFSVGEAHAHAHTREEQP